MIRPSAGPGRAALYLRVSTKEQDAELQREELRRLAARRGWEIIGEYADIISGAATKRPGLDRLLADAHAGRFDVVAVWKLDRLGRSLIHMIQVVDGLLGKGVHVVSATEPHMDSITPQGRLLRNIMATIAEYERELIREHVVAGLARARAHGVQLGRRPRLVNLNEIARRREAGQGWKKIARALKVPARTLRRRFEGGHNPPTHCAAPLRVRRGFPRGQREGAEIDDFAPGGVDANV